MPARILAIAIVALSCLGAAGADVSCDRIVAVGDLHGGYEEFIAILQKTELIGEDLRWKGERDCLVQEGDIIDRGDRSGDILDLLMLLKQQAPERVFILLGNHEFLRMIGDLRYVSPAEFAAFAMDETQSERAARFEEFLEMEEAANLDRQEAMEAFDRRYPPGWFALRRAFAPEGRYGAWLLERPTVLEIDGTLFVHGGLTPVDAVVDIEQINQGVLREVGEQHLLRGQLERAGWIEPLAPFDVAWSAVVERQLAETEATQKLEGPVEVLEQAERYLALARGYGLRDDGPLWHRLYAEGDEADLEPRVSAVLAALKAERMVLAHTHTIDYLIQSRFDDRVFLINTGAGPAYEGSASALVIDWTGRIEAVYSDSEELMVDAFQSDRVIEKFLLHGEIVESEEIGVGVSRPRKLLLEMRGERMKAAFKSIDLQLTGKLRLEGEDYRPGFTDRAVYERAAYLLDRYLGLNMVPASVMRKIDREQGAVIHWISDAVNEKERRDQGLEPPDPTVLERQKQIMRAFDVLIGNEDRNLGNMLITTDDWKLHLIDHSRSFRLQNVISKSFKSRPTQVTRAFYERLQAMDRESMDELLGEVLSKARIKALLSRRNWLVKKIEKQRQTYGDDSVF